MCICHAILQNNNKKANEEKIISHVINDIENAKISINDIKKQKLDNYISLSSVNYQIQNISKMVHSNPTAARELIYKLNSDINYLRNEALNRKREEERIIREQKNKNKQVILNYFNNTINNIDDIILIDFAKDKFDILRNELLNDEGVINSEMKVCSKRIESRVKSIIDEANANAGEWRAKKEKEREKRVLQTKIEDIENNLNKENIEKRDKLLKQIENAKLSLNEVADSLKNIEKNISSIGNEIDDISFSEDNRRYFTKSIIKLLKHYEFTVSHPEFIENYNGGIVKIEGIKPSGKKAVCYIEANGKLKYILDEYESTACMKSMDKFENDLFNNFNIKLLDKSVTCQIPNNISKNAIDINNNNKKTL